MVITRGAFHFKLNNKHKKDHPISFSSPNNYRDMAANVNARQHEQPSSPSSWEALSTLSNMSYFFSCLYLCKTENKTYTYICIHRDRHISFDSFFCWLFLDVILSSLFFIDSTCLCLWQDFSSTLWLVFLSLIHSFSADFLHGSSLSSLPSSPSSSSSLSSGIVLSDV